ncbi:non-heme iron oxygenase ferredoxin subunit [Granulicoccus sp. GXG6511]|uniref:non-heme iron oxygenase ferredoxin subunit n=1 Tax=Granulicoccus sp. GXG6511 TaxID=3381351 RepID=UPI003D7E49AB
MSDAVRVAAVEDVEPGEALRISRDVMGTQDDVVLVRTEAGEFYALDNTCSHALASLAEGWVEDDCIECPLHAAAFSLETGEALSLPATEPVGTHAVEVRDGEVWVTPGSEKGDL